MSDIPSPCIKVCKFRRAGPAGEHCIGCSMTKEQKSLFKGLSKKKHQQAFVDLLITQQSSMGRYRHWLKAYEARCEKKGVKAPV